MTFGKIKGKVWQRNNTSDYRSENTVSNRSDLLGFFFFFFPVSCNEQCSEIMDHFTLLMSRAKRKGELESGPSSASKCES